MRKNEVFLVVRGAEGAGEGVGGAYKAEYSQAGCGRAGGAHRLNTIAGAVASTRGSALDVSMPAE